MQHKQYSLITNEKTGWEYLHQAAGWILLFLGMYSYYSVLTSPSEIGIPINERDITTPSIFLGVSLQAFFIAFLIRHFTKISNNSDNMLAQLKTITDVMNEQIKQNSENRRIDELKRRQHKIDTENTVDRDATKLPGEKTWQEEEG